jgi:uncharacterized protein YggT (Ycf19 family)
MFYSRNNFSDVLVTIIDFLFTFAIVGLVLRFLLRLFGANPSSDFVNFVYDSTSPLLDPFRGIFTPYVVEESGAVVEFSTLFAIGIYLLVWYLITELIYYVAHGSTTRRRTLVREVEEG